ncbi:LPO_1073/Vpar_1526 family protein [Streptomyces sp. BE230]|uniref:LPO_1073/Vpar_1526 family protein n=1 Tax=Streptomyces sp. BE230 TaxID=3002526 RepID=UPI002ED383AB|nr:LPO_1073/Vpar_1526 family protein [Streptomyces sp. BE230]
MKWNTRQQKSRDNSLNMQAGRDIAIGMGYRDVKEISRDTAMEVFTKNFQSLSREAHAIAQQRADEFTLNLVESLQQRAPYVLEDFQDPGTQSALFSAQSGYAKTGDADLGEVLIELLISRASCRQRATSQLASNFAVGIAEHLSSHHFAILTCNFALKQLTYGEIRSIGALARSIGKSIEPFFQDLKDADPADLDYLAGLGCTIATAGSLPPGKYAGLNYPGLFTRGFSNKEIMHAERLIGTRLVRPFGPEPDRYQINAITKEELLDLIDTLFLQEITDLALSTLANTVLDEREIERMLTESRSDLAPIFRRVRELEMNGHINTAIGTAIAHANMRRIIPEFDVPLAALIPAGSAS